MAVFHLPARFRPGLPLEHELHAHREESRVTVLTHPGVQLCVCEVPGGDAPTQPLHTSTTSDGPTPSLTAISFCGSSRRSSDWKRRRSFFSFSGGKKSPPGFLAPISRSARQRRGRNLLM